ncbi:MAG: CotH kinase family protein [Bacteroidota bacterium]
MTRHTTLQSYLILLLLAPGFLLNAQVQFPYQSVYRYLKGNETSGPDASWVTPGFDASAWSEGAAPFWYGDGSGGTQLTDMRGNYPVFYLRSSFTASQVDKITTVSFAVNYDDGFIIWINGTRTLSRNAPDTPTNSSYATAEHESGVAETIRLDKAAVPLVEGANTIAVQVFNVTLSSSDIHFELNISAQPELPPFDTAFGKILYSHPAGFYDAPFDLELSASAPGLRVAYTLDGTVPGYSGTTVYGDSTVSVNIDPTSTAGRPQTAGVVVRAALIKEGYSPSISRAATYLFIDRVRSQAYPGAPWPSTNVNGQVIDLPMDPDVVNDPRYSSLIEEALLQVPTYSVVTDLANLFNPSTGIYVNASNHGEEWERECSVEMLDPEGEYFQVNAGIRIRGGASRGSWNPKHAFRLFFRADYGDSKLRYPLFGDEGAAVFNKVDLRTEQNYSWSKDGDPAGPLNTFIKDIYARKLQGEMGQPYSRSRYCHLYINGLYWGLFMTEERPEADYAESYFGDDQEDYDVIKVTTTEWPYYNIATDGNMAAWTELWNLTKTGYSSNTNYFALEGKDALGQPVKDSRVLVDIDNLIDYMATIFYTGNVDAPVSAWYGETMPNNYYAIYNRKNKGTGFIFVGHDNEHIMMIDPLYVSDGIQENRVTIPEMNATSTTDFQPQWLHYKLSSNAEYRLRFADRVNRYFAAGGIFCPDTARAQFAAFGKQIDQAIIAESARWGDAQASVPRTKDDDWLPALNALNTGFFPVRASIVAGQLKTANLLPDIISPAFTVNGKTEYRRYLTFSSPVTLKIINDDPIGDLWYTTDGSDPRMTGGATSASAISSQSDVDLNVSGTTLIHARVKSGSSWSALSVIALSAANEDYSGLKITEIHYHPADIISGNDTIFSDDQEFIELKNTGSTSINLSGISFDSAVWYLVPAQTLLSPGQFYVIAAKPEVFYQLYGRNPDGNFDKHLSNGGELILIQDPAGNDLFRFSYSDNSPWPATADGDGFSLSATKAVPDGDPGDYNYWMSSINTGGSPYADDPHITAVEPLQGNAFADRFSVWPNPASDFVELSCESGEECSVEIYDASGKSVYVNTFTGHLTLACSELGEKGVYFAVLSNRYQTETKKIILL